MAYYAGYRYYQKIQAKKAHQEWVANLKHTASPNVQILNDTIEIDYLGKKRTLAIYLPANYEKDTSIRYPVLYFLDGDALFDEKILEGHEWQLDEVLDSLGKLGGQQAIVVGIYNSKERRTEYKPYLSPLLPEETSVSGREHAEWIATDLKNWVDQNYRTLPDPSSTVIGGASLGGLMAYYMLMTFSNVYDRAIVFSPSFWVNEDIFTVDKEVSDLSGKRIYFNAGELETPIAESAKEMHQHLLNRGMAAANLKMDIIKGEGHWHMTWRIGFRKAFPWILE